MKTKLSWIITPYEGEWGSDINWDELIEIESKVGVKIRPTKKSAMKFAEKLAEEFDYPMEIYWKKGKKLWKQRLVFEKD